ncbi:tyrosine-type recombinase/integrase [Chromobacterium piscinae]|uniref:tyrosine-type recombinase/integrase n=1 Tax=Chromobacterium piscinae TaxID=686831 RepID=UPI001E4BC776|nr:site-specific integrase [Chromobacterium piscinae]MCD5327858.1 site-specific integrase [Chromobacterium piscinae]
MSTHDAIELVAVLASEVAAVDAPPALPAGDLQAVADWLAEIELNRSLATWRNYRKEVQRLLLWLQLQQLTLATVTRRDLGDFQRLLQTPPASWLSARRCPLGHAGWRPLSKPLAPASVRQALVILHGLFDWLLHQDRAGVRRNPLHRWPMPAVPPAAKHERVLSRAAQAWLQQSVAALPRTRLHEYHTYYRARWLLALLLIGGLRREEVVNARMGDFKRYADLDVWVLQVLGKGGKPREVSVTAQWLAELRYYREQALGLAALPTPDETTPLLMALNGKAWLDPRPVTAGHLYQLVKTLLKHAAAAATDAGQPHLATELARASTHWFRHSALTAKLEAGVPLEDVSAEAGHSDPKTTLGYAHKSPAARARRQVDLQLMEGEPPPAWAGFGEDE